MQDPNISDTIFNQAQLNAPKPKGTQVFKMVFKYAFLYSITAALYDLVVFKFLQGPVDLQTGQPIGAGFLVKIILLFVSIFLCNKEYRDTFMQEGSYKGAFTVGKAVYTALLVGVMGGILFGIYGVIKLQYWVQVDYDKLFEFFRETTEGMVDEEREFEFYEMARTTIYYMYHPLTVYVSSFLFSVFWSLILGFIAGSILKK